MQNSSSKLPRIKSLLLCFVKTLTNVALKQTHFNRSHFPNPVPLSQTFFADTICRQWGLAQFGASTNSSNSILPFLSLARLSGKKGKRHDSTGPQPFLLRNLHLFSLPLFRRQNASQGMTSDKIMLRHRVACVTGEVIYDEDPLCPE